MLSTQTVEELSALAAPTSLPSIEHALILDRSDRPVSGTFGVDESRIERLEATGQAGLMDIEPFFGTVPAAAIESIADWFDGVFPAERAAQSQPATDAIAVRAKDGSRVTERVVTLGPHDLFGILATGDAEPTGPPVLFLNSGRDPHTGPNRMWVDLSRDWAALGFPCYRFDLSGLGDSPVRPGQVPNRVRVAEAFDDVVDAVADVVGGPPTAGRTARRRRWEGRTRRAGRAVRRCLPGARECDRSAPRSVLSVNPILRFQPWEVDLGGPMDPRRRFCKPAGSLRQAYRSLPSWKILRLARARYLAFAGRLSRQRTSIDWLEEAWPRRGLTFCASVERKRRRPSSKACRPIARRWKTSTVGSR